MAAFAILLNNMQQGVQTAATCNIQQSQESSKRNTKLLRQKKGL